MDLWEQSWYKKVELKKPRKIIILHDVFLYLLRTELDILSQPLESPYYYHLHSTPKALEFHDFITYKQLRPRLYLTFSRIVRIVLSR